MKERDLAGKPMYVFINQTPENYSWSEKMI